MKKLLNRLYFCLMMFVSASALASFYYDKKSHSFIFNEDMSIYIEVAGKGKKETSLDSFGYYLNDDTTFYAITEADLGTALNFKAEDKVTFVKHHNDKDVHKMKVHKVDADNYLETIYKVDCAPNGNLHFKIVEAPKASGQPLPSVLITAILGGMCLWGGINFSRKRKQN